MNPRSVILVAGGSGTRMNAPLPKQFLKIHNKPVIVYTIEAFLNFDPEIRIILVLPKDHFSTWQEISEEYFPNREIVLKEGGATRFQSVRSGLSGVLAGLVAIHDAVRPLITSDVIRSSFESAEKNGSGVVMVPLRESIRRKTGSITRAEDRSHFYLVQTPQTFQVELIKKAFLQDELSSFTDDATVFETAGMSISDVAGDYRNIKITSPEDLLIASTLLK